LKCSLVVNFVWLKCHMCPCCGCRCLAGVMATNGSVEHTQHSSANDNFWEIDGFKRTVRRTEDGMHQCGELMKMMQERAEIEKEYAKRLRVWCKKWADNAEKGTIGSLFIRRKE